MVSRRESGSLPNMVEYGTMASMVKVTFTLDEQTVERLRRTAPASRSPRVRRSRGGPGVRGSLHQAERRGAGPDVAIVDRMVQEPPTRTAAVWEDGMCTHTSSLRP